MGYRPGVKLSHPRRTGLDDLEFHVLLRGRDLLKPLVRVSRLSFTSHHGLSIMSPWPLAVTSPCLLKSLYLKNYFAPHMAGLAEFMGTTRLGQRRNGVNYDLEFS